MFKDLPPQDLLRKLLRYEPDTGKLFWLPRPREFFNSDRACNAMNAKLAGKEAFTCVNAGYRKGRIMEQHYVAHRICWAIYYGSPPVYTIDHIDGDRENNRISNLRDVPMCINNQNAKLRHDNKSGHVGVMWDNQELKWRAQARYQTKTKFIGLFDNKEDAITARQAAEIKYGFHQNHGRTDGHTQKET